MDRSKRGSDKNQTDDDDKSSDSSEETLTNGFVEDIRMEREDSTSSGENFVLSRMKKKVLYLTENQENESPRRSINKASRHSTLRPFYENEKYADASRLLRSKVNEDEDSHYNYNPDEIENHAIIKTIMVGSDYQAQVPEGLCHYDDALPYENDDKLIWDPTIIENAAVEDYLRKAETIQKPSLPLGSHLRDNEQFLFLLQQCGHNIEEALRRLKMNIGVYNENMSPWSEEECRNFEAGVRVFGKNFYLTQQNKVRTRSVGELVQFYYLWKKSERHDIFANKVRLEKKKYALHPGVTDFMDRFLEDQDMRDSSSSPNVQIVDDKKCQDNQNSTSKNEI
ncbi:mesoderm induction early response protein 1-like [Diorhabda sublineata]|uniref:mesoderm induction early response protein 1-like n=1 Tax=Diorhabda sublineata TaxID=1163346 RepID=UPI0024E14049|nr:mesoderm induction early response protein 1-like [Diorhabda sublineata]XP_056633699.1 mesoderm induction early response protein 1-like [Diorhabda sublineata]